MLVLVEDLSGALKVYQKMKTSKTCDMLLLFFFSPESFSFCEINFLDVILKPSMNAESMNSLGDWWNSKQSRLDDYFTSEIIFRCPGRWRNFQAFQLSATKRLSCRSQYIALLTFRRVDFRGQKTRL